MKIIQLTRGQAAVIDDEDYELVSGYKWHYMSAGYAGTDTGGRKHKKKIYLHRLIMDAADGEMIDHIDGDKLNNQRSNLRFTDSKGNQRNQRIRNDNTSGYRGVYWDKSNKKWKAQITVDSKRIALGGYSTKEDAAEAYNAAAIIYHGEFASINENIRREPNEQ